MLINISTDIHISDAKSLQSVKKDEPLAALKLVKRYTRDYYKAMHRSLKNRKAIYQWSKKNLTEVVSRQQ